MPLLFVLAGISAKFSILKRGQAGYLKERLLKLLLPLIFGTLTVVALMAYYADRFNNHYSGSFLQHYLIFLTKVTTLTGYDGGLTPAHLWFLLYLFLISLLSFFIIWLQKCSFSSLDLSDVSIIAISLLFILTALSNFILNIADKSIGKFLVLFLAGFYLFSEEKNMEKLSKYRRLLLTVFLISNLLTTILFIWMENNSMFCYITCRVAEWFGILTLLGYARLFFNASNKITAYLTSHSFLIYIFHFGWLVILQYYLQFHIKNSALLYFLSVLFALILTLLTSEIISRIPILRFLFGMKRKKRFYSH